MKDVWRNENSVQKFSQKHRVGSGFVAINVAEMRSTAIPGK